MLKLNVMLRSRGRPDTVDPLAERGWTPVTRMTESASRQILGAVGGKPPENGALLGGDPVNGIVRHVVFDDGAVRTGGTYSPDHVRLNRLLSEWWRPSGIYFLGFVHSHPRRFARPSSGDLRYADAILKANPHLARLLMPIVTVEPEPKLHPFVVVRTADGVEAIPTELELLSEVLVAPPGKPVMTPKATGAGASPRSIREETFLRVNSAYDLPHLRFCRVMVVGCGGSASFVEDLVRAGVCDLVLVDPDDVSAPNIATQHVYRPDIGLPKVDVLSRRVRDINPAVEGVALKKRVEDISDAEVESLLGLDTARPPIRTLICGCTDNFFAQARVNRIGLQLGVPTLCAQVYAEGRGAEITFTHPTRTQACHRCILKSRYDAFLNAGFTNTVTSDGTPICSTSRLNATKVFIALAILHDGTVHPRWGRVLEEIGNRNLVQLRLDPDLALPVFDRVLTGDRARIFSDDKVWLPQQPEGPATGRSPCPDCGGTGDLRSAIGTFIDTRLTR